MQQMFGPKVRIDKGFTIKIFVLKKYVKVCILMMKTTLYEQKD